MLRAFAENFTDFDDEQAETDVEDLPADGVSMAGGRWKPSWCIPRHRIAVIIPFRNRENHINVSVPRIRSFLRRQLLDHTIFVVEQARSLAIDCSINFKYDYMKSARQY
jgi:hypothetical protein